MIYRSTQSTLEQFAHGIIHQTIRSHATVTLLVSSASCTNLGSFEILTPHWLKEMDSVQHRFKAQVKSLEEPSPIINHFVSESFMDVFLSSLQTCKLNRGWLFTSLPRAKQKSHNCEVSLGTSKASICHQGFRQKYSAWIRLYCIL